MSGDACDRYTKFFHEADTDNDGQLSVDELTTALRNHGYTGSDLKIQVKLSSYECRSYIHIGRVLVSHARGIRFKARQNQITFNA